jgi:hypothetical protein
MGMVKDGDCLVAIGFDASISVLHTLFTSVRLQALSSPTNPKNHMSGVGRFHPTWFSISIILHNDNHFCITSDYSIGRNWSRLGTITKRKKMIPFCFRRTSVLFFGHKAVQVLRWNKILTWNWGSLKSSLVPFRRDRGDSWSFTQDVSLLIELYQSHLPAVLLILPWEEWLTGTYQMFVHSQVAFERDEYCENGNPGQGCKERETRRGLTKGEPLGKSEGGAALYFFPASSFQTYDALLALSASSAPKCRLISVYVYYR